MTDLSGIEYNKTFTNAPPSGPPYYYINAYLDLAGLVLNEADDQVQLPHITLYFNRDNNYKYLDPLNDYYGLHIIESTSVIGDVVVYSNPDLVSNKNLRFNVGGAVDTDSPVSVTWGGRTGFSAESLNKDDINNGQVCFFGHEGGHLINSSDDPDSNLRRYLAVTITELVGDEAPVAAQDNESVRSRHRERRQRLLRQLQDYAVDSGVLHVTVKVYPKYVG